MICEERLLKVLLAPHMSEKASIAMEKQNTIVLNVAKDATKTEIKVAVYKLFKVEVNNVRTMISSIIRRRRYHGKQSYNRSHWKKAYVTLKQGQNLDFIIDAK